MSCAIKPVLTGARVEFHNPLVAAYVDTQHAGKRPLPPPEVWNVMPLDDCHRRRIRHPIIGNKYLQAILIFMSPLSGMEAQLGPVIALHIRVTAVQYELGGALSRTVRRVPDADRVV